MIGKELRRIIVDTRNPPACWALVNVAKDEKPLIMEEKLLVFTHWSDAQDFIFLHEQLLEFAPRRFVWSTLVEKFREAAGEITLNYGIEGCLSFGFEG